MSEGIFQVAACAIIEAADGKILLLKRRGHLPGGEIWEGAGGRLNQFESFEDGLKREVAEETGITDLQVVRPLNVFTFMRGGDTAAHEVKGVVFWRKTSQTDVILSEEHSEFAWQDLATALAMTKAGVRRDLLALQQAQSQL